MPTYILDRGKSIAVAAGTVSASLQVGKEAGVVRLEVVRDDAVHTKGLGPASDIRFETAHDVVIPTPGGRTVIRVAPAGEVSAFGSGAVVNLSIRIGRLSDDDPVTVVATKVDVAGLQTIDLMSMEFDEAGTGAGVDHPDVRLLVVTRLDDDPAAGMSLAPLAEQARVAARRILGRERTAEAATLEILVALDHSASMRALGTPVITAAVEIIAGISRAVAPGREVDACLLADPVRWIRGMETASLATELLDRSARAPLALGLRSADVGGWNPMATGPRATFIVTDALPADVEALAPFVSEASRRIHLLVISEATGWDESVVPANVTWSLVDPDVLARPDRLGPREVGEIVEDVLSGLQHVVRRATGGTSA